MALGHNVGERPPWIVRDGLLECRDDDALLEVRGKIGGTLLILWCWKCGREFRLLPYEVDRMAQVLEDTRKTKTTYL